MNDPVKCPDCGVWWRGETHMCFTTKDFICCPKCGKNVAKKSHHTCESMDDLLKRYMHNKKKGHPDDKGQNTGGHA